MSEQVPSKERVREYVQHKGGCNRFGFPPYNCTCGLDEVLAGLAHEPSSVLAISKRCLERIREWMLKQEEDSDQSPSWEWIESRREVCEALAADRASQPPGAGCPVHGPCPVCEAQKTLGDPRVAVTGPTKGAS